MDALFEKSLRYPICQIVGPHGTGKSTLLLGLLKCYENRGEKVRFLFFNDQHRRIPDDITFQEEQLFVDGMEQLPKWEQVRFRYRAKRLIFTVHRPLWFIPILYRTQPQFSVFVEIVRQLLPVLPDESVLREVFDRSGCNFRSAFFDLYDRWEKRD